MIFLGWTGNLYFKMYDFFSVYGAVIAHLLHNVAIAFFTNEQGHLAFFSFLVCFLLWWGKGAPGTTCQLLLNNTDLK